MVGAGLVNAGEGVAWDGFPCDSRDDSLCVRRLQSVPLHLVRVLAERAVGAVVEDVVKVAPEQGGNGSGGAGVGVNLTHQVGQFVLLGLGQVSGAFEPAWDFGSGGPFGPVLLLGLIRLNYGFLFEERFEVDSLRHGEGERDCCEEGLAEHLILGLSVYFD